MFATLSADRGKRAIVQAIGRRLIGAGTCDTWDEAVQMIRGIVEPASAVDWLSDIRRGLAESEVRSIGGEASSGRDDGDVVGMIPQQTRRRHGLFMTPRPVARGLAGAVEIGTGDRIVDLAAGTGRLLEAAIREEPTASVVGIEKAPELAALAAANLLAARDADGGSVDADRSMQSPRTVVHVGDGLARREFGRVDAVLLNPPYGGEKGRAEQFRDIRDAYPRLNRRCGARYDLAYFFVHRAIDHLGNGGKLGLITTEYWLTATGAAPLRRHLAQRMKPVWMVRAADEEIFPDAPGQHTLFARFDVVEEETNKTGAAESGYTAATAEDQATTQEILASLASTGSVPEAVSQATVRPASWLSDQGPWRPFVSCADSEWADNLERQLTPLGDLAVDRQGFVSGADRVSRRRLTQVEQITNSTPESLAVDDPAFLWHRDEIPDRLDRYIGTVLRPVVRGSQVGANEIVLDAPSEVYALYIDGELPDEVVEELFDHLEPLRPSLADRREVRRGTMPWYRLHWPRDRQQMTGPKLVVPRRANRPRFCLDLSGAAVSSDCTYLAAPSWVERPLRHLSRLMHLLNGPTVARYLRVAGKAKGSILEFYAEPLRRIPLPLERRGNEVYWSEPAGDFERDRIDQAVQRDLGRLRV